MNIDINSEIDIYYYLSQINCVFVTTNVDRLFHRYLGHEQIKYKKEDFIKEKLCMNNLYHIHGMLNDKENMIFTTESYIKRYKDEKYISFLYELFSKYDILFIGYGLSEFEILDFLLEKAERKRGGNKKLKNHFYLFPLKDSQKLIVKYYASYFEKLNINLIPYNIGDKNYHLLLEVIKDWVSKIITYVPAKSSSISKINIIIKNNDYPKMKNIYKIIYNHRDLEKHFFEALIKAKSNLDLEEWFDQIKNHGFFNPKRNPDYNFKNNKEKTRWIILIFLERIFGQNGSLDKKIIDETNNIIEYTLRDENINNYSTNQLIIKILSHLDIGQINETHVEFIMQAIKNEYDNHIFLDSFKEGLFKKIIRDDNDYFEDIINSLFKIFKIKGTINEYQLAQYSKIIIDELNSKFYPKLIEILENKMKIIMKEKSLGYLAQVYDAFADNHKSKNLEFHYQVFNLMKNILIKPNNDKNKIYQKIKGYLETDETIFNKIAIYAISKRYDDFNEIFWNYTKNPLTIKYCKNEILNFFLENKKKFTKEQIDKIIQWMNEKYDNCSKDTKIIAKNKKKILFCLLDTDNEKVKKLYDDNNKIDNTSIIPPNEEIPFGKARIVEPKAKYKHDILSLDNNNRIVKYINDFTTNSMDDRYDFPFSFKAAFESNPNKFINDLDPFLDLNNLDYLLSFISILSDNVNENTPLDKVFIFVEKILEKANKGKNFINYQKEYGLSFESAFINLFRALLRKVKSINLVYLDKIVNILIEFTKKQFKDYNYEDLLTKLINSETL